MSQLYSGYSVSINDIHLFDTYGLIMTNLEISSPEVQTKYVEVPGRNGAIDLTEALTGDVRYNDREITISLFYSGKVSSWTLIQTKLNSKFLGQSVQLKFDDDLTYYWQGRITSITCEGHDIEMVATVEPYKRDIATSADEWLWDPFDFEEGYINTTSDIQISGDTSVVVACGSMRVNPIITSDSAMTVTYDDVTYNLVAGTQTMYDIFTVEGNNTFTFHGNGIVTIIYRGGSL